MFFVPSSLSLCFSFFLFLSLFLVISFPSSPFSFSVFFPSVLPLLSFLLLLIFVLLIFLLLLLLLLILSFFFFFFIIFFCFFFSFFFFCFFFSSSLLVPLLLLIQVPLLLLLLLLPFRKPTPRKKQKRNRRPKNIPRKGAEKPSAPRVWCKYVAPNALPPAFAGEKNAKRAPPRVSRSSGHQLQSKNRVPPEKRGKKKRKKMGTKSWVLKRTAKRGSQNWVDFFKKKRISHYVFACFVHMGSKFGVLLSTRQHIYIYIYMYVAAPSNSGRKKAKYFISSPVL